MGVAANGDVHLAIGDKARLFRDPVNCPGTLAASNLDTRYRWRRAERTAEAEATEGAAVLVSGAAGDLGVDRRRSVALRSWVFDLGFFDGIQKEGAKALSYDWTPLPINRQLNNRALLSFV
ncbi:hypothetical protein IB276_17815 [Ensifer sp. ENS04]|uniref:hypothetical protein n=1 Tax=Ensifer sp. ENS04 TaxID=2769281 RepID=UPI00177BA10A|nr:hypothetical protein [Ensifer sp. ENS04]MBD9541315.1 hypothetical protein [Ensifer sp. ENS04]